MPDEPLEVDLNGHLAGVTAAVNVSARDQRGRIKLKRLELAPLALVHHAAAATA